MVQIIVKKNAGAKFLVALGGQDSRDGRIECIVSLPREPKSGLLAISKRQAVLLKTRQLVDLFSAGLYQATQPEIKPINILTSEQHGTGKRG